MDTTTTHARAASTLPPAGFADVRVIAATPETARLVAALLRRYFAGAEQRSYPAGPDGSGTLLHLTVDTTCVPELTERLRPWVTAEHPGCAERW